MDLDITARRETDYLSLTLSAIPFEDRWVKFIVDYACYTISTISLSKIST